MDHLSVGQDRFDPGDEVAGVAVGDHRDAAGVGRDIAADGAGPLGRERKRKEPVGFKRRSLRLGERHAGLADHHVGMRIDFPDRFQPLGREDDFVAARVRRLPAHEPGVAALRHNSDPRLVAEGGDRSDFPGRARPDEGESLAPIEPPRLDQRSGEEGRVGQHMTRSDDAFKSGQRRVAHRRVHPRSLRASIFALGQRMINVFPFFPRFDAVAPSGPVMSKLVARGDKLNNYERPKSDARFPTSTDRIRRKAPVADRGLGRLNWAENAPTGAASGTTAVRAEADLRQP